MWEMNNKLLCMLMNTFLHAEHTKIGNNFQKNWPLKMQLHIWLWLYCKRSEFRETPTTTKNGQLFLQFSHNRLPSQIPMRWVYLECSGSKLCMIEHKRLQRVLRMHTTSLVYHCGVNISGCWVEHGGSMSSKKSLGHGVNMHVNNAYSVVRM